MYDIKMLKAKKIAELIEIAEQKKLQEYLEKWLKEKINFILKSLIDLRSLKESNSSIRALAYQLYENNGVLKRDKVSEYLKNQRISLIGNIRRLWFMRQLALGAISREL